ncbi:unnamed protein product (macronuclear) [Paramecium tetraurelia]|uniref:Anoctamin transmembrane domain-containing protein n=1 Tax=Paramecium tetraurelia TaxID=5888 RepID=A0D675_PARTE|nr:uncharacterized protein GSPATT00013972001 [Paramecium tetraurelia]CAK78542.1 unnamed protein product [Paramecium tetraurelia]|eukprot:XP_001445939.1 hypothetical protein (macronuclear) [Paramecium tetraurelia strain d4-2]
MLQLQKSSWAQSNSPRQFRQNSSPSSPSIRSDQVSRHEDIDDQWDVIVEDNFVKKVGSNQNQRFESDFTVQDQDKRNILHQTALRQDAKILELLIQDYHNLLKENKKQDRAKLQRKVSQIKNNENEDEEIIEIDFDCEDYDFLELQDQVKKYVQQPDIFGCTPIQICCFLNDPKFHQNRQECLKILIENGSDVNEANPHNLWRPLHWCSFYGDEGSVKLLLQNKAFSFLCDYNGLYPMDLAGKNQHNEVLEALIDNMVILLKDCQFFWNGELIGKKETEFIEFQEICSHYEAELQNPLLYTKILFWCCRFKFNKFIKTILEKLPRIYIMFPIKSLDSQTCLHACCFSSNAEALKMIIKFEILDLSMMKPDPAQTKKQLKREQRREGFHFKILSSYLEQITKTEVPGINQILQKRYTQNYKERYYHELQRYLVQDQIYRQELAKVNFMLLSLKDQKVEKSFYDLTKQTFCRNVLKINVKDNHGNTPLHLASLNGDQNIIKFLLNKFADPEAENFEFFRAKQLTRDLTTQLYYDGLIKKQKYMISQAQLLRSIELIFQKHKEKGQKVSTNFEDQYNLSENIQQKSKYYRTQLKIKGKTSKSKKKLQTISQIEQGESAKLSELRTSNAKENSNLIQKPKKTKKVTNKIIPLNFQPSTSNKKSKSSYDHYEQLILFSSQLFVPDIVLKFDQSVKVNLIDYFKKSSMVDQKKLIEQQINFQIDLLQKAEFEIYMMFSFTSKDYIYIMLRIKEEKLERLAEEMEMQIKMIDSYDLEQFKMKQRNKFEPFRSSQRQKIVYEHLLKSINLESLMKSKLIDSCYAMHTSGGIQIVKREWQKLSFGFIPQPICQIKDYLSEGSGRNFTSLTTMRLYFGEQISFFFAWISYLSCISLIIAIPGLILQIYVILYDFHSEILPYWVLIVTIWSTVQTELWKRKTSEINTRWGCIDQMLQAESSYYEGPLKDKFSGDEEINNITKRLTKHQQITKLAVYFVIFLILLAVFLLGSFGIVYGIDLLRKEVQSYKGVVFLLGALQAIAIQVLNILFHYFSKWYADVENHKFELSYEKSLIYKNVFFRFINSYMPLMYIIVTSNDYNLEDIFYFLIPLVLVKKAYYILIDFLIPALIIRAKIKIYFSKVKEVSQDQRFFGKQKGKTLSFLDEIEQFWTYDEFSKNKNSQAQSQSQETSFQIAYLESASRTVLKVESEEILEEKLHEQTQNPKLVYQPFETKIDTDAIELNSFKDEFGGTLDYFMEAVTDYGYFILFSAAFPIGPFIGIILNVVEIQMKLYKLIYMTKRIKSERMPGIGQWLNILEFLSAIGVFTNFVLLYFKHRNATLKMFTNDVDQIIQDDLELWYFISCVIAVTLIKILVRELIPDRPDWVIEEIDKINHRELVEQQEKAKQKLRDMEKHFKELRDENIKLKKEQADLEQITDLRIRQLDAEINKLEQQFQNISRFKKIDKLIITEYDMIVLNVLKNRYYQFDNIMLTKRLLQFIETRSCIIQICQECGKCPAILECLECQENFCGSCYSKVHTVIQQMKHNVKLKVKKNEISEQIELNVIQDEKEQKQGASEQSKLLKKQIGIALPKRNWKKIEYFFIPLQIQSGQPKLNELYSQFGDYYLKSSGLEFRDFRIVIEKILPLKDVLIAEDSTLRLEDKIFLNRIAFQLFRKKKHSAEIQQFLRYCTILQTGQLEQRIFMFFDFIDINEDDQISKTELEGLFLASFVQDLRTNKRVYEVIDQFFPNNAQIRIKREVSQEFFNKVNRSDEFRTFLEALLQVQGVKC